MVWTKMILLCLLADHSPRQDAFVRIERTAPRIHIRLVFKMPRFNLTLPTLGGRQWWGDVRYFRGYRIQQHIVFGHYRLLDPRDVRRGWGSLEECTECLNRIIQEKQLPPMSGRAVIVIHGLFRSSKCFGTMARQLEETGVTVIPFDYPSTRVPVAKSADYLRQVIDSLEGVEQIDLVVHSLGGLVVRTYLQETAETGHDPRLRRLVMVGVPNRGARLASMFCKVRLYQWIYGPPGQQLVEGEACFASLLPTPDFEFAVIAGGRGTPNGWNPLIPGDDDGTVSVEATKLPGASDFIVLKVLHTPMLSNTQVIAATLRFLETGSLHENGERSPIPVDLPTVESDTAPPALPAVPQ